MGVISYLALRVYDPAMPLMEWVNSERVKVELEPIEMEKAIKMYRSDRVQAWRDINMWLSDVVGKHDQMVAGNLRLGPFMSMLQKQAKNIEQEAERFRHNLVLVVYGLLIVLGIASVSIPLAPSIRRKIRESPPTMNSTQRMIVAVGMGLILLILTAGIAVRVGSGMWKFYNNWYVWPVGLALICFVELWLFRTRGR